MKAALQKLKVKVWALDRVRISKNRYLRRDIVGDLDISMGTSALGMHNSLRDSLTSEVSEFVQEVEVLGKDGAARASRQRVLVVVDGGAAARSDNFIVDHVVKVLASFYVIQIEFDNIL